MKPNELRAFVREAIRKLSTKDGLVRETIKRSELKAIIKETLRTILKEITVTGDVAPINLPGNVPGGWVAKQGGSKRALAGSPEGMTVTKVGQRDWNRDKQDKV